jgi:hypothetical protein
MESNQPPDELAAVRAKKKPGSKPGRGPRSHPGPTTGKREVEAQRKSSQAVQLRVAGATLTQIAERLGYADASGAHRAITRALKEMLPEEDRQAGRRLELAKLDRLEMSAWPNALAGDDKAANVILRCIGMRAKLLGLEAPAIVDVRVREGEPVHVEILEVLNEQTLEALRPFQEEMVRLSELRAGAIDVPAT